jgi:hypothetical protein
MTKLKRVGFFRELDYGIDDSTSLIEAIKQGSNYLENKASLLKYLKLAPVFVLSPGITRDVLSPSSPIIGSPNILTDGHWVWPEDLAYYVEKYNIFLPKDFLEFTRDKNYQPPNENDVDFTDVEL